ncbi:MAG: sulfoxide reductase heme-binding subunit YedZ [Methylococcus sp.]|nr:sulfoxide reductase heme-binding subunit YedZ [Methylococcus sp.]
MQTPSEQTTRWLNYGILLAGLMPFLQLAQGGFAHELGANPVETIAHTTGLWALRLLLATLAITPLRAIRGWHWLARMRRGIALLGFFYATLHVLNYLVFDHFFDWREIVQDVLRRPHIAAGLTSFLIMVPLAATSSKSVAKRLGSRSWQRLHRGAYAAAIAGVFHYFWLVKQDTSSPALYAAILALLLCLRLDAASRTRPGDRNHSGHQPSSSHPSGIAKPRPTQ